MLISSIGMRPSWTGSTVLCDLDQLARSLFRLGERAVSGEFHWLGMR
jgi:hypothetical protein